MTVNAFPLSWPVGFPRRKSAREKGSFKTTLTGALNNVRTSLRLFGADSGKPITKMVISSNVTLGIDSPADPGVAVWFTWEGMQVCIPVDRYMTTASNLQAIHHVLEARRVELRHGTLALVRASLTGLLALPGPSWRSVFGLDEKANLEAAEYRYRTLAKGAHPDTGGSQDEISRLNIAIAAARQELA